MRQWNGYNKNILGKGKDGKRGKENGFPVRVCNPNRKTERREIYFNESADWAEDCHYIGEAADDKEPDSDGLYDRGRADRIFGYAGDP